MVSDTCGRPSYTARSRAAGSSMPGPLRRPAGSRCASYLQMSASLGAAIAASRSGLRSTVSGLRGSTGLSPMLRGCIIPFHERRAVSARSVRRPVLSSRIHIAIAGSILAAIFAICAAALVPDAWIYASQFRDAGDAIDGIETFRKARGSLPATLFDIGRPDDEQGPLYYSRYSEAHYTVWFAAPTHGFFGTYVYDSETRTWHVGD